MTKIYLIRHGSTEMNNENDTSVDRIRGWSDVPLDEAGRKEADKTGKKLRSSGIKKIYTSDLERAKDTAKIISKYCKVNCIDMKELRPWDLGEFTGKSTKESLPKIEEYACDTPEKTVPKGESFDTFKDRAFKGLNTILRDNPDGTVGIVTHHRYERLLKSWIKEGKPADRTIDIKTFLKKGEPPGSVEMIELTAPAGGSLRNTIKDAVKETAS